MPKCVKPCRWRLEPSRCNSATMRDTSQGSRRERAGRRAPTLERFFGIDEDGDRPFIHKLHGHHRLKNAPPYFDAQAAQGVAELAVQRARQLRGSRGDETGPPLAA